MPLQVEERTDIVTLGHGQRAGGDHHDADAGQRDHHRQQHAVELAAELLALHRLRNREPEHQRTFRLASPTSTSTTVMIQKRTITRGSGQPFNSKW